MERQILCGNGKALEVVTSSDGHYNACLAELGREGLSYEDMAMKRLAQAKLLAGDGNNLWQMGRWTTNGFVYLPCTDILVTAPKYTPFLRYADKAVAEHKPCGEIYVGDEYQELMDNAKTDAADAIKTGVLLLKRQGLRTELPVEALGDIPVTCFLLEDVAQEYGMALKNKGRESVLLIVADADYARQQNRPFSRGLWALNLSYGAAFLGSGSLCYLSGRVSGVSRGELSAAKRAEASGASHSAAGAARAGSTGNAGLDTRTLEQVLAVTGKYTADVNKDALQKELAGLLLK